jgi:hypothetical protein
MEKNIIPKLPWNIYWINLDRRPDRRKHMEEILENNKENSFRIQAVDYKNSFAPYNVIKHDKLNGGEHGCTCSHIKALHYFLTTSTDEYCFIAEDDLCDDYSQYWQEKHFELLKNGDHEILQLQTTGNSYKNIDGLLEPECCCDAGTTFYKIQRYTADKIVSNHYDETKKTICLSNHNNPLTDVFIWSYGNTFLLPLFSYLDVTDSDTNKEANSNMTDYWQNFFKNVKDKHLSFWQNI